MIEKMEQFLIAPYVQVRTYKATAASLELFRQLHINP